MDTITLKLYGPYRFKIRKHDWFLPEIKKREYHELTKTEQQSQSFYLRRFHLKTKPNARYVPKVDVLETLDKENKQVKYVMIITFSVPKLLYGNSVQEVSEKDLPKVVSALRAILSRAGIEITERNVLEARATEVHFCKNIFLPQDILLQDILAEIGRTDLSKTVDVTTKETKNGGQILHIYSGVVERVFYDKVTDALRPKNKRKDKSHIDYEREIIDELQLQDKELFRYEYRIKKTVTVERIINQTLGRKPKSYVTLQDVFTDGLHKKVLQHSWQELVDKPENQLALIGPTENFKLLRHIIQKAISEGPAHSMNKALIAFGITTIIRSYSAKEFKRLACKYWNDDHPERLNKKIKDAAKLAEGLPYSNGIAFIDGQLGRFERITRSLLDGLTV